MIDYKSIRLNSLDIANRLGYQNNPQLPLLDETEIFKTKNDVVDRICVLHALAACSYGFPAENSRKWLNQEELTPHLTESEISLLDIASQKEEFIEYRVKVEAIWALCWSLQIIPKLDFGKICSDSLISHLPDLKKLESINDFKSKSNLRNSEEVIKACDLSYCLHWSIVEAQLNNSPVPGTVPAHVVTERRHALEWLLCNEKWDDVVLDT